MSDNGRRLSIQRDGSAERGRAARATAPRSAHGDWAPAADRPDPIEVGAAAVMAADLAATPDSRLPVQTCGDAHISNFGGFAAPDRRLVFDLNDFDETLPGPWEWDVKRMAASVEIAGRERAMRAEARRDAVATTAREYRKAMRAFAEQGHLGVWYARMDFQGLEDRFATDLGDSGRKALARASTKARRKDSVRALTKLTHRVGGRLRFVSAPPLLVPVEELLPADEAAEETQRVTALIDSYATTLPNHCAHLLEGYRYVHMARKVVGVGSVGTRAWIVLLEGRDAEDPLVLQAKEAGPSVLEPYVGGSEFACHGERVVHGQRLMQAASDIFLGWTSWR